MLSLKDRFELLGRDLVATPMRISAHSDLPFAILRYEPDLEWEMRQRARQLKIQLGHAGREMHAISPAAPRERAGAGGEGNIGDAGDVE